MRTQRSNTQNILAFLILVSVGVAGRLMPHVPNFTPLAAVALFAGYFISMRSLAVAVPVVAMALSDAVIGGYNWSVMASVYVSLLVPITLRPFLVPKASAVRVASAALVSSLSFFLVTNFAVCYFGSWYSHDVGGLAGCYASALPFLKYTVAGDLTWSAALFGIYGMLARCVVPAIARRRLTSATPAVAAEGL